MHPPVDTDFYRPEPGSGPENRFLVVSALVPYKRVEVAIRACARVGTPLTIVGRGPETSRLQNFAETIAADVTFEGWIENEAVRELYRRSRAVIMPGVEDFGMVPVEAQACGRPVVVLAQGGAPESVVEGVTGILVRDPSAEAFADALAELSRRSWDSDAIRAHAETFSTARFQQQFRQVVEEVTSDAANREDEPDAASHAQRSRSTAARGAHL